LNRGQEGQACLPQRNVEDSMHAPRTICRQFIRLALPGVLSIALAMLGSAKRAAAVDIAGVQNGALDAPQVIAILQRPNDPEPIGEDAITSAILAYLDTGSSGMLIGPLFADALGLNRLPGVTFFDIGIGGPDEFDVSEEIIVRVAPNPFADLEQESSYTHHVGPVHTQVGPLPAPADPILDSGFNIVGMPAMVDKVVVIDPKPLNQLLLGEPDGGFLNTFIYDPLTPFNESTPVTDPGIPDTSFNVKLSYGDFSRFTSVDPEGSPAPNLAHNPFIGPNPVALLDDDPPVDTTPPVGISFQGHEATGSFLLDTGGQTSFMSTALAAQMGVRYVEGTYLTDDSQLELFDPLNPELPGTPLENQFQLLVGGIGGNVTAAGFFLDTMTLHTMEGSLADDDPNNIRFLGAPMLVADIGLEDPLTGEILILDGTIGINFFVATLFVNGFDLGDGALGAFSWVKFDEPNGILGLELIAVVPEPGSLALAGIGVAWLAAYAWRRRVRRAR
jgi:hypothetical protein